MGKSLTEVARSVLMNESNDSAPDRDAKKKTENMNTLHPKSKTSEPDPKHNEAEDLGPALVKHGDVPGSAKAAGKIGKDKSRSSQKSAGDAPKKLSEEEEALDALITHLSEEGFSEQEIYDIITEAECDDDCDDDDKKKDDDDSDKDDDDSDDSDKKDKFEISEELEDFISECIEAGLNEEEIEKAVSENFDFITEDEELDEEQAPIIKQTSGLKEAFRKNAAKRISESVSRLSPREDAKDIDLSEDMDALFEGEELSEDFKSKAATIFEAAVMARVDEEVAIIEQAYSDILEEQIQELEDLVVEQTQEIQETLESQVNDYTTYVAENWAADNEVAIESGLKTELTEDFLAGLKNLFAEHYVDIPEDKVHVIEEMGEEIESLKSKINSVIDDNVSLTKKLHEAAQSEVFVNACDGLSGTEAEKLRALIENIKYTDIDTYSEKVNTLKESYFPRTINHNSALDKAESSEKGMISEELHGPMASYVKVLGKSLPR